MRVGSAVSVALLSYSESVHKLRRLLDSKGGGSGRILYGRKSTGGDEESVNAEIESS